MPAAILALLLLTATVDPRLAEPLRVLGDARDATGHPIGTQFAHMPDALHLAVIVAYLPPQVAGRYLSDTRIVAIAERLLDEDPRVVATVLAHERRHASDVDLVSLGLLEGDCVELEVRGFEAQAQIARALYPDDLPSETKTERQLAVLVRDYEANGADGIRARVSADVGCLEFCAASRLG